MNRQNEIMLQDAVSHVSQNTRMNGMGGEHSPSRMRRSRQEESRAMKAVRRIAAYVSSPSLLLVVEFDAGLKQP